MLGVWLGSEYDSGIFLFWSKLSSSDPYITQLTFTCSKSTIESPEKDVKYIQS